MRKFNVYYDEATGEIRALSPNVEPDFAHLGGTKISFEVAFKFLNGEYNTTGWFVASCSTPEDGVLTQDQFDFTPQVDEHLSMVPRKDYMFNMVSAIDIAFIPIEERIEVTVPELKIKLKTKGREDMVFYVTKRNDPSEVYSTFTVNVDELFKEGKVSIPFTTNVKDFSVYTKKMFRFYQFSVQHTLRKMAQFGGTMRHNKLVDFRYTKKAKKADNGINVIHNINNRTLELHITGDTSHIPHYINDVMLMLTKHRDPTVLIDTITYDIHKLINDQTIVLPLPDNVGDDFGLASYPYMEQLTFTRK
jgi:hypothetical protein